MQSLVAACLPGLFNRGKFLGGVMKRVRLVPMFLVALAGQAAAQDVRQEVLEGASRCAGIADDRNWLDCFYGSAQPMRSRLNLPPAPAAQIRLVPPPGAAYVTPASVARAAPPREQGFFADVLGTTRPTVREMPMESYSFDRAGRFTVRLQNGQVYVQEENDLARSRWKTPAGNLLVTLQSSGDKYDMRIKSEPGTVYRVRRR